MKVNKLEGYAPEYPAKKGLKTAARIGAAAAAVVLTSAAAVGCGVKASGFMIGPEDATEEPCIVDTTEDVSIDGKIVVDPTEEPEPTGVPAVDPTEEPEVDNTEEFVLLMGDVAVDPEQGIGD